MKTEEVGESPVKSVLWWSEASAQIEIWQVIQEITSSLIMPLVSPAQDN